LLLIPRVSMLPWPRAHGGATTSSRLLSCGSLGFYLFCLWKEPSCRSLEASGVLASCLSSVFAWCARGRMGDFWVGSRCSIFGNFVSMGSWLCGCDLSSCLSDMNCSYVFISSDMQTYVCHICFYLDE
jgi:hypothetical protein